MAEHTSASDLKLVITYVANIPLPIIRPSITTSISAEVIQAAHRLMDDAEKETLRK